MIHVCFFSFSFSGQIFGCTLWSDHATKFMFWFKENLDLSPIVIILTLARVKMPQGMLSWWFFVCSCLMLSVGL